MVDLSDMTTQNVESAKESMEVLGYAPNPYCKHCGGSGRVHPMLPNGKTDYSQSVMCHAEGCLWESYNKRALK